MRPIDKKLAAGRNNFVFIGGAGSGKSEIALNVAAYLARTGEKEVHFFDMDMTKPLFRSRDIQEEVQACGIRFHFEEQFMDAPTLVGGVNRLLKDDNCYVVMDVGGDHIGARAIGGYAPQINKDNCVVYYVLNAFRPWTCDMEQIDRTLGEILGMSHIQIGQLHLINNPNFGYRTTAEAFMEGDRRIKELVTPYKAVDFTCVEESLYGQVKGQVGGELFPLHLYLTYPWLEKKVG